MTSESSRKEEVNLATAVRVAELGRDMSYVREKLDTIDDKVSKNYVTKEEFDPIKRLVYGTVALVLTVVGLALLALIVTKGSGK